MCMTTELYFHSQASIVSHPYSSFNAESDNFISFLTSSF